MIEQCGRGEIILKIIKKRTCIKVNELLVEAEKRDIEGKVARSMIKSLLVKGKIYQPHRGVVELVEY